MCDFRPAPAILHRIGHVAKFILDSGNFRVKVRRYRRRIHDLLVEIDRMRISRLRLRVLAQSLTDVAHAAIGLGNLAVQPGIVAPLFGQAIIEREHVSPTAQPPLSTARAGPA